MASMVLALLKIFQCSSWKVFLLENGDSSAQLSTRASLFSLSCMSTQLSTGSCDLNWAKVKDFPFAYPLFMRICSLVLPYLTHKLFPPQDTSLLEDWAGSESHYSDFTVTEVAKFTKKRGSENTSYILRNKGVQVLWWSATGQEDHLCSWSHLWPWWEEGCANECKIYFFSEDELYHEVPSMKEILLEEIFQSLKLILKKYWMKKGKLMMLSRTIFT